MSQNKSAIILTITVALLIVGNLIGAGILALPVQTGLSGFIPSLLAMVVVGGRNVIHRHYSRQGGS